MISEADRMRRIPELDALRGCAAIGIVLFHYSYPSWIYDHALYAAQLVLEMFFVLSGFLITSIILRYRESPSFLLRFYMRRGLRIWPIYYLALAVVTVIGLLKPALYPLEGWWHRLFYLQDIQLLWSDRRTRFAYPFSVTWSLAVEEQFYILWPPLVLAIGRRLLVPVALGLVVASTAARVAGYSSWLLLARCDGFALGGVLAALVGGEVTVPRAHLRRLFAVAIVAALAYLAVAMPWLGLRPFDIERRAGTFAITAGAALFFGIIGLVILSQGSRATAILRSRALCYIGLISYGIYLYHIFVLQMMFVVAGRLGLPAIWPRLLGPPVVLLAATLSWYLIERPILSLKDRFGYDAPRAGLRRDRSVPSGPIGVGEAVGGG